MIHFLTHITTDTEITLLPGFRESVAQCFPGSVLHVFNQTGQEILDTLVYENIKSCGFGWTLRFLRYAGGVMGPQDVLVKIDPDIELFGNPLAGMAIRPGECFGQLRFGNNIQAFMGGFQGYTRGAVESFLRAGQEFESTSGPQDHIAYRVMQSFSAPFVSLAYMDLWADPLNYDPCLKVRHWKR